MKREAGGSLVFAYWNDDCVASIIATSTASTNVDVCGQDVNELAFALVSPLGAEYNGN